MPYNVHPLSWFTIAYLIGILVQAQGDICFFLLFFIGLGTIIVSTKTYALPMITWCSLFFVGGIIRFWYEKSTYDELFLQEITHYSGTGYVSDIQTHIHPYFKKRITIKMDMLSSLANPTKIYTKKISLYLYVPLDDPLDIDDEITLTRFSIKKPKNFKDFVRIMRTSVVASRFDARKQYHINKTSNWSWRRYLHEARRHSQVALKASLKKTARAFYTALFLGNKTDMPLSSYIVSRFNLWGISHHLARSGLHLIIIMWLWLFCIQRMPIATVSKHIVLFMLCTLYYLLSWSSVSFDRACLSYVLYRISSLNNTPLDAMHAISLVIIIFLLISPAHLFCLDFQLSFGLTYALAWFNHTHTKLGRVNEF